MNRSNIQRRHAKLRGASMIEFVLIAPIALVLILATVQVGFMYVGKLTLNHATYMAARAGAVDHADHGKIRAAVVKGLVPFYQDTTDTNSLTRISKAWGKANADTVLNLSVDILNPSPQSFSDFGFYDADPNVKRTRIPSDNMAFRNRTVYGASGQNIQDANLLKIRVTYGYELKVPLMATLVRRIMCGSNDEVKAFGGNTSIFDAFDLPNCLQYYWRGRIPIVSFATVRMQSDAYK